MDYNIELSEVLIAITDKGYKIKIDTNFCRERDKCFQTAEAKQFRKSDLMKLVPLFKKHDKFWYGYKTTCISGDLETAIKAIEHQIASDAQNNKNEFDKTYELVMSNIHKTQLA